MLVAAIVVSVALAAAALTGSEYYTSQSSFCGGSCHIMQEPYDSWKNSKHFAKNNAKGEQAECIDCHFLPGEKKTIKAKYIGLRHLAAYLYDPNAHMPVRPVVKDGACLRSGCHSTEKFQDKEIKFTEKTVFKHKAHLEKETIKGQKLFCETCHVKRSAQRHFETPKEICFICHFKPERPVGNQVIAGQPELILAGFNRAANVSFNKGANKCSLCHTVPTKSLQRQLSADDPSRKPITHQSLEKAGVPCESCHLHQVVGADAIKTDECLDCHSSSKALSSKGKDGNLMHDKHVAGRRADCLDCHRPPQHAAKNDYLDGVRASCAQCHRDQHRFQKVLLEGGRVSQNVSPTPSLMHAVTTNCAGCHTELKHNKGELVKIGSGEACANCHTPEHREMLDKWKKVLEREVVFVKEVETEALQMLAEAEGKLDAKKLKEARETVAAGHDLLNVVLVGNGVHNKKYSIMILDEAIANFEHTIDLLNIGQ